MFEFDPDWLAKLEQLRAAGIEPYPAALPVSHTSTALHRRFRGVVDPGEMTDAFDVAVGGRVLFRNHMGKAMFLRLQDRGAPEVDDVEADGTHVKRGGVIQVYARREEVGDETFQLLKGLDIGDFVWARGRVMRTRTGELTVQAVQARLAAKILTPFPDRWHAVTDVQTRARQRYVDLFINAETRETFRKRSRVVAYVRDFFDGHDFLEVETPMMQVIPGGAAARPFVTHHNALDIDLYLRVAPELYLKRLVVGGFERVFEINRNFRNEGISVKHNPEFTMLEFYQAWATWQDLMTLTEDLLVGLVDHVCGTRTVEYQGRTIDFTPEFRRVSYRDLLVETTGLTPGQLADPAAMAAWWADVHPTETADLPSTRGKWWELLFDRYAEHTLVNPTFVTEFPVEISPLSRRSDRDPEIADRFELICNGWEIANGFSELNDPVDQAARFEAQARARDAGDEESMYFDADYVRALTYGMPPTAGEGIGIDRLVMLLTNRASIREVILFPTLRPVADPSEG